MNAQKGKDRNKKFSLYNLPNWNGEYVADFPLENRLASQNTEFPKKKRENYRATPTQTTLKYSCIIY